MPWSTPTLREVRSLVRDSVHASLPGADANVPNSVLRVLSDSQGALCHLTLQYVDWLALQLLPDTAETEWLDRHGKIWLVNADGTTGRKLATLAEGTATFTATVTGTLVPVGTVLTSGVSLGGLQAAMAYETLDLIYASSEAPVTGRIRALDPGTVGNLPDGSRLSMTPTIDGVDQTVTVVTLDGGTDEETDEQLRDRVLRRIRQPPMGGDANDYVQWALAVPGVTRAWCSPLEMGMGTVTVRFMMDDLRADNGGFPTEDDCIMVAAYLDTVRPVAVKDFYVVAPIQQPVDCQIVQLVPDTEETRAQIETSLREMLFEMAAPGQTIYAAWKSFAIMNAPSVQSFLLVNTADDVMPSPGHMAVLGSIIYDD